MPYSFGRTRNATAFLSSPKLSRGKTNQLMVNAKREGPEGTAIIVSISCGFRQMR